MLADCQLQRIEGGRIKSRYLSKNYLFVVKKHLHQFLFWMYDFKLLTLRKRHKTIIVGKYLY